MKKQGTSRYSGGGNMGRDERHQGHAGHPDDHHRHAQSEVACHKCRDGARPLKSTAKARQ